MQTNLQGHRQFGKGYRFLPIAFLLIAAVLAWCVWLSQRPRQPELVFRGRPLSYWLTVLDENPNGNPPDNSSEGEDTVPMLTKALETRGNVLQTAYRNAWPKLPAWIKTRWPRPIDAAKVRANAALCLGRTGTLEFRINLLKTHPDPNVRISAAASLGQASRDEKATTALADALLEDKDSRVRTSIIENGFAVNGHDAAIAVPALIGSLEDKSIAVQSNAAYILTVMFDSPESIADVVNIYNANPDDKQAVIRQLVRVLKDKDPTVHDAAVRWLRTIDRQAAAKAGAK